MPAMNEIITSAYIVIRSLIEPSEPTSLMPEYKISAHAINGSEPA